MKKLKLFAVTLALILIVLSIASCIKVTPSVEQPVSSVPESAPVESSAADVAATPPAPLADPASISDDPYSFQVLLDGVLYELPAPYSKFVENGWVAEGIDDVTLKPNQMTFSNRIKNAEHTVSIRFVNLGVDVLPLEQCLVGNISLDDFYAEKGAQLVLPKGITLGSTYNDIIAAYGEPSELYTDSETTKKLTYALGSYDEIVILVDKASDVASDIDVTSFTLKSSAESNTATSDTADVPDVVKAYKAPSALGDSWDSFTFKLAGTLYKLPVPVAAFIENGWVMVSDGEKTVPAQSSDVRVEIRKDNQVMRTTVQNYSDTAQPVKNCFITNIKVSPKSGSFGADLPLELPNGITQSSTMADVAAAYGSPDKTDESTSLVYYTYGSIWKSLDLVEDKETKTLTAFELEYSPKTLDE